MKCPPESGTRKYSVAQFEVARSASGPSHAIIIRPAPTLRRDPGNNLIRVLNVARLAMHAVRGIQADPLPIRRRRIVEHLINIRRTKMLARAAVLANAARIADV